MRAHQKHDDWHNQSREGHDAEHGNATQEDFTLGVRVSRVGVDQKRHRDAHEHDGEEHERHHPSCKWKRVSFRHPHGVCDWVAANGARRRARLRHCEDQARFVAGGAASARRFLVRLYKTNVANRRRGARGGGGQHGVSRGLRVPPVRVALALVEARSGRGEVVVVAGTSGVVRRRPPLAKRLSSTIGKPAVPSAHSCSENNYTRLLMWL